MFLCEQVCKGEQLCVCMCLSGAQQVTIRIHDKYTHSQPFTIWIVVVYCRFQQLPGAYAGTHHWHNRWPGADQDRGVNIKIECVTNEHWMLYYPLSKLMDCIGFYAASLKLHFRLIAIGKDAWRVHFAILGGLQNACIQLRKISAPCPPLCRSWIYYDQALCPHWAKR